MERKLALINQLVALAFSAALVWIMIPEHKRKRIALSLIERARRQVLRSAWVNGQRGIDLELAGDLEEAQRCYDAAYKYMTSRHEKLVELYKTMM